MTTNSRTGRDIDEDILAAARESIIERGIGKATIADVANRAGTTRPTVYHRYANIDVLSRAVLSREVIELTGMYLPQPRTADELVELLVSIAGRARESEFLNALIEHDTQLLAEYQFLRLGSSQLYAVEVLTELLRPIREADRESNDPSRVALRDAPPQTLAMFTLSLVQSAVFSAGALAPHLPADDTWRNELHAILKGYLAP